MCSAPDRRVSSGSAMALASLRLLAMVVALSAAGCSLTVPSGAFQCDHDGICPNGQSCFEGFCVRDDLIPDLGPGRGDGATIEPAALDIVPPMLELPAGGSAQILVRLARPPDGTVIVRAVAPGNEASGLLTVFPETIGFDESNWDTPVAIDVQDTTDRPDGGALSVVLSVAQLSDDNSGYRDLPPATVPVTVLSSSAPRIVVTKTQIVLPENGSTEVGISLASPPDDTVTVDILADGVLVDDEPLVFSPENWALLRAVQIRGDNDRRAGPDRIATVTVRVDEEATADSSGYRGAAPVLIAISVLEDDVAGIELTPTLQTLEEGGSFEASWRLTSEPDGIVCIDLPDFGDARLVGWPMTVCRPDVNDWADEITLPTLVALDNNELESNALTSLSGQLTINTLETEDTTGYAELPGIAMTVDVQDRSVPSVEIVAPGLCAFGDYSAQVNLGARPESGTLVLTFASSNPFALLLPNTSLAIPADDWTSRTLALDAGLGGPTVLTVTVDPTSTATGYPPGPLGDPIPLFVDFCP